MDHLPEYLAHEGTAKHAGVIQHSGKCWAFVLFYPNAFLAGVPRYGSQPDCPNTELFPNAQIQSNARLEAWTVPEYSTSPEYLNTIYYPITRIQPVARIQPISISYHKLVAGWLAIFTGWTAGW